MLLVGSDDGLYRFDGFAEAIDERAESASGSGTGETTARRVLETDERVLRVAAFDGIDGVFAASPSGLYHSMDGEAWADLAVPETRCTPSARAPTATGSTPARARPTSS